MKRRWTGLLALALAAPGLASEVLYSPHQQQAVPMQLLWGDTHIHTRLSADANFSGNLTLGPEEALRFARGEEVVAPSGLKAQLARPLDFLVISDHAEYLGLIPAMRAGDPSMMDSPTARRWMEMLSGSRENVSQAIQEVTASFIGGKPLIENASITRDTWAHIAAAVDEANTPGAFTAFTGFEWTSMPGEGNNLHRVVVFRDGAEKVTAVLPYSAFDSENPEDLWRYLASYEQETGGQAFAIPHNSNVSNGLMFTESMYDGSPPTPEYTAMRARWEPLVEITQIKGDSEAHPLLSPGDEFADYGTWDRLNLLGNRLNEEKMLKYEYTREALKLGLRMQEDTGSNPYRFGVIGSSDAHNALAAMDEDNFWSKGPTMEPSPTRARGPMIPSRPYPDQSMRTWEQLAAGYAAVWATENTREAIFDAMQRREVYATTGPRMSVRFFAGWEFADDDALSPHLALTGYRKGVPMGGVLSADQDVAAPTFLFAALKDTEGANLDRVQVVKGWHDPDSGELHERVYDVAWSGEREPGADGRLPPVGDTVDLEHATYRNSIGTAQLSGVWRDPDFDPGQRAFYYLRVLEIPTPRWVNYDVLRLGAELETGTARAHQERAYTSPIWYEPAPGGR